MGGGGKGQAPDTWSGLPGSRTFCTMLLFSNPQLLLYQELGSRGGWDGSVGSTHTERGYGTPLEPSPPSIVRWLPRTQQDRRNANVRIVQRYVIVIRDRTSTRSNALIANLPAQSPDEFATMIGQLLPSNPKTLRDRSNNASIEEKSKNLLYLTLTLMGRDPFFVLSYPIESRRKDVETIRGLSYPFSNPFL